MSRAYDLTNLYHNSQNSSSHVSSLATSRRVSDLLIGKSKVRLNSREQGIFPSLPESLAKTDICSVLRSFGNDNGSVKEDVI